MDWVFLPPIISLPRLWRPFAWRSVPSLELTSPNQDCKTKSDFRKVDTIVSPKRNPESEKGPPKKRVKQ